MIIHIDNDTQVTLEGLRVADQTTPINDATVVITLVERDTLDDVLGQTWPVTMNYVSGTDGNYRAVLSNALVLDPKKQYTAVVDVDAGEGLIGSWRVGVKARYRHA